MPAARMDTPEKGMVIDMRIRNKRSGVRTIMYYAAVFMWTIMLTLIINLILLFMLLLRYRQYNPEYIHGGMVMEALTPTATGYELSIEMQERLTGLHQWAMLLDGNGEVIWSYRKPAEIKDSYSRSDIANMSRWYLQDYPVYLRVWDDKIMVVGCPKDSVWKYNIEFPLAWIRYILKTGIWLAMFDFLGILALMAFFLRRGAKDREQARIEWIAGISHDIRTPLSMVLGYADMLERSEEFAEEERREAAAIRHQSIVMKELIEDLNLTSRLEYSMQPLRVERVRPAVVVREVAAAFLSDAKERELEIEADLSGDAEELWIRADEKLLIRALRNLFHNSLQHGRQGETLLIRLRIWRERKWCCISFADNGTGYSAEVLRGLQGGRRKRAEQKIRGLGIVQKIVLAHGGRICFRNNAEGGCACEMRFREYCAKK